SRASAGGEAVLVDRADDRRGLFGDLVGDFPAVDVDVAGELERDAHAITLDGGDPHDADRVLRVADDDLFTLTSCDDQHGEDLLSLPPHLPPIARPGHSNIPPTGAGEKSVSLKSQKVTHAKAGGLAVPWPGRADSSLPR